MRLRDIFILEGADDEKHRDLAQRCVDATIKHLGKNPKPTYTGQTDEGVASAFKMNKIKADPEVIEHFKHLIFFVESTTTRNGASFMKGAEGQDLVTLYVVSNEKTTEEKWEKLVMARGKLFVEERWEDVFHEFVHMLDTHRHKDQTYSSKTHYDADKVRDSDPKELETYYNSPMEYNAYVQADLQKFAKLVKGAKTFMEAQDRMRAYSERQFIENFIRTVGRYMRLYMTPEIKRHVVKRASQFWRDLEKKFSG